MGREYVYMKLFSTLDFIYKQSTFQVCFLLAHNEQ